MTLGLRYAARSDVGLLREGNEDSAYAGPRLLAVADGMGGHAHGEVASAVAIAALAPLDEDVPGSDLLGVLEQAVREANRTLHRMVEDDASLEGMGTTLTAMLWSGARVALCHIGDSRAYLLRDGDLYQITKDHTLVQSLVDEGRITPEEAATHPQRSLLLRALDGRGDVEPDLSLREAQAGDRYLLCSDGLSSVVSADTLLRTLTTIEEPEQAVRALIDLANRGGGPDNITCIVADAVDVTPHVKLTEAPVVAGAAANAARRRAVAQDTPAGRAHTLTRPAADDAADADEEEPDPPPRRRRWPGLLLGVLLVCMVGGAAYGGWRYTQSQYYVGTDGIKVVIYQGLNQSVGGYDLSRVHSRSNILLGELPDFEQQQVRDTIQADSLQKAEEIVNRLQQEVEECKSAQQHRPQPVAGERPTTNPSVHAAAQPTSPTSLPPGCPETPQ